MSTSDLHICAYMCTYSAYPCLHARRDAPIDISKWSAKSIFFFLIHQVNQTEKEHRHATRSERPVPLCSGSLKPELMIGFRCCASTASSELRAGCNHIKDPMCNLFSCILLVLNIGIQIRGLRKTCWPGDYIFFLSQSTLTPFFTSLSNFSLWIHKQSKLCEDLCLLGQSLSSQLNFQDVWFGLVGCVWFLFWFPSFVCLFCFISFGLSFIFKTGKLSFAVFYHSSLESWWDNAENFSAQNFGRICRGGGQHAHPFPSTVGSTAYRHIHCLPCDRMEL